MFPCVVMKFFCHSVFAKAAQNRGVQNDFVYVLRVLCGKTACGDSSPAPTEDVDFLLTCLLHDFCDGGMYVFCGIVRIGKKTVFYGSRLPESRNIKPPDSVPFAGKFSDKAVILIINVEFVR